jgi:hypothetical protein
VVAVFALPVALPAPRLEDFSDEDLRVVEDYLHQGVQQVVRVGLQAAGEQLGGAQGPE